MATSKRRRSSSSPARARASKGKGAPKSKQKTGKSYDGSSLTPRKSSHADNDNLAEPTTIESDSSSREESQHPSADQTPEPDFILAEVTHERPGDASDASIPPKLLHTILNHHFQEKEKTRLNNSAKELLSKYVDIFVREAITRASYEREGANADGDGDDSGFAACAIDGWLEVEHLEKIGAQLVLDF